MRKHTYMLNWQDLQYFLAVARHGSLSGAANELQVDHTTVSRRVSHLETATGLKLIDRLPRTTRLTEQGRSLADIAASMEGAAQDVQRHVRGQSSGVSGTVVISALPVLTSFVIAPSLASLRSNYPELHVVLSATSAVVSLERGEADISLGFVRPDTQSRIVRKVGMLPLALYAHAATENTLPDTWSFICFETSLDHIPQQRWLQDFAGVRPFVLRTNDVLTQYQATRSGLGLSLLPCLLGDADAELVKVSVDAPPSPRPLWMSVHADIRKSPAVRVVMDHLVATFAELLPAR